jgi:hypothetical protein
MPKLKKTKKTTFTRSETTVDLTGDEVLEALAKAGLIPTNAIAVVSFQVPGGGDWSNVRIQLDEESCLTLKFATETRIEE